MSSLFRGAVAPSLLPLLLLPAPSCQRDHLTRLRHDLVQQSLVATVTAGRGEEEAHQVSARVLRQEEERER